MAVDIEKIAVALGRAAPASDSLQAQQWQMWIDDAKLLIELRAQELNLQLPDEAKVDYVVRQAVVAQVRKPDDATQVTISVDDGSSSKTYQSGKGRVAIVDEWWVLLGLVAVNTGAYSFDTVPSAVRHLPWCSCNLGATFCSCGTDIAGRAIYEGRG
jgi:hypothetical protein